MKFHISSSLWDGWLNIYPSLGSIQSWWHWWRSFPCLWSFCSLFMWDIKGAACVSSNFHKISKIGPRRRGNQSCFVFTWNHIAMVCWRREGFFFLPPAKLWDRIQYLGPTVSSNKTEESNILDLQWKRVISQFTFYTKSVNSEEVMGSDCHYHHSHLYCHHHHQNRLKGQKIVFLNQKY